MKVGTHGNRGTAQCQLGCHLGLSLEVSIRCLGPCIKPGLLPSWVNIVTMANATSWSKRSLKKCWGVSIARKVVRIPVQTPVEH